jgi:hypothetical protein
MYESLISITPPAAPSAAALATFKAHCRVDASDTTEDLNLTLYLQAATAAASSYMKHTFSNTSYQLTRDLLPTQALSGPTGSVGMNVFLNSTVYPYTLDSVFRILNPPLISVESIQYLDTSGTLQTLSADFYKFVAGFPGRVAPAYGKIWPFTLPQIGSVILSYTCGYGTITTTVSLSGGTTTTTTAIAGPGLASPITTSSTAATVAADVAGVTVTDRTPFPITAGILLWAGALYRNREAVTEGVLSPMPYGVQQLFESCNKGYYK